MQPIHEICYNQIMHLPTSTVLYTWKIFLLKDFRKTENLGASYNKHGQRTRTKTCEPQNQTQHRKAKSQKVVRYTRRNAQNTANNQTDPVTKVAIISTRKGKSVQYSGLSWEVEDGVASESEKNKISWINFVNYVTSGVCVCVCIKHTWTKKWKEPRCVTLVIFIFSFISILASFDFFFFQINVFVSFLVLEWLFAI